MTKSIFQVITFLFITSTTSAQIFDSRFDRQNPESFKGKYIYIRKMMFPKPNGIIFGFYKSLTARNTEADILYPVLKKDDYSTMYHTAADSVLNKKFLCVDVIKGGGYAGTYLKLENEKTGTVYFDFSHKIYIISQDEIDAVRADSLKKATEENKAKQEYDNLVANPCSRINKDYDEFHFTTRYSTDLLKPEPPNASPYTKSHFYDISFDKEVSKSRTIYYISISTTDITPMATEQGVIIILKNGKRLNKPLAKVKTTVNSDAEYVRSTFITLTPADILLLKQSPIKSYELYITQVNEEDSNDIYQMFLCLLNKK